MILISRKVPKLEGPPAAIKALNAVLTAGILYVPGLSTTLSPEGAFFLATLGGAEALGLDQLIGNFQVGKEADLQVLNPVAIPLIERRFQKTTTRSEELFALLALGDERCLVATYVLGDRGVTGHAH